MSTFPMIAADGTTADVPEASVAVALSKGAKHAVQMLNPADGSKAYVPMDQAHIAIQKGAQPIGGLPSLRLPDVKENLTGNIYAGVRDFSQTMLRNNPITAAQSMTGSGLTEPVSQDELKRIQDEGGFLAKSSLSNAIPNLTEDLKNTFAPGDTTGARVGAGAANAVTLGRTIQAARGLDMSQTRVPLEKLPDATLDKLRKVANPDVNDLHFDAKFMKHGSEALAQFEQANGRLPQTAHELGTAFLDSAKANRELYYGKMIPAVENDALSTPNGYGGAKLTPGTASVRQLDARLTDINNMLDPKYSRGGVGSQQAQAAVGAGEARALKAEAASIRSILYPYLGQRLGISAEQVGGIRDSFGAQRHIGETILISENERFAKTAGKEMTPKGLTINPLSNTKEFVLDKALNAIRSDETPADRAVREAMAQVRTGGMTRPTPNVQPPQAPPTRTPAWKAGENGGTPPASPKVNPPSPPPNPEDMTGALRFRINDLSAKLRKADPAEKGEIEAELSRTKEMIDQLSPRAKETTQSLKSRREGEQSSQDITQAIRAREGVGSAAEQAYRRGQDMARQYSTPEVRIAGDVQLRQGSSYRGPSIVFGADVKSRDILGGEGALGKKLFPDLADQIDPLGSKVVEASNLERGFGAANYGKNVGKYQVEISFKSLEAAKEAQRRLSSTAQNPALLSGQEPFSPKYKSPEDVMLAMKSGSLSQIEGNRLLQKLRGKSHAVTRPIPPPP